MAKVALIAAYDKDGRLLFGVRNDNGKYTLPGGHIESKETPEKAAVRELLEETGLRAKELELLKEHETDKGVYLYCFKALVEGEPTGENDPDEECSRWYFVDVSDGVPKNIYENLHGPKDDDNIVKQLYDMKKSERIFVDSFFVKSILDGPFCNRDDITGAYVYGLEDAIRHYKEIVKDVKCKAFESLLKEEVEGEDEIDRLLKHPNIDEQKSALKLEGLKFRQVYAAYNGKYGTDIIGYAKNIIRENPDFLKQAMVGPSLGTFIFDKKVGLLLDNPKATPELSRALWNNFKDLGKAAGPTTTPAPNPPPTLAADYFERRNTPLDADLIREIYDDRRAFRSGLLNNHSETPSDILEKEIRELGDKYGLSLSVLDYLKHPNLTEDVVKRLWDFFTHPELRSALLDNAVHIPNDIAETQKLTPNDYVSLVNNRHFQKTEKFVDDVVNKTLNGGGGYYRLKNYVDILSLMNRHIEQLMGKGGDSTIQDTVRNKNFTADHFEKYILDPSGKYLPFFPHTNNATPEQIVRAFDLAKKTGLDLRHFSNVSDPLKSKELYYKMVQDPIPSSTPYAKIFEEVYRNKHLASPEFWEAAANNPHAKRYLYQHPDTPDHVLQKFALTEVLGNLIEISRNPKISSKVISTLLDRGVISEELIRNPNTSTADLGRILFDPKSQYLRNWGPPEMFANHPNMTSELVKELSDHPLEFGRDVAKLSSHLDRDTAIHLFDTQNLDPAWNHARNTKLLENRALPIELVRSVMHKVSTLGGVLKHRGEELPTEFLKSLTENPAHVDYETVLKYLKENRPDSTHKENVAFSVGTSKLRRIRDLILNHNANDLRPKDIPFPTNNLNFARLPNGNISADKLQQAIDSAEKNRFNVSQGSWTGVQRHSKENSKVFQLNLTDDHIKRLKEAGAWDDWKNASQRTLGVHPVTPTTVGWVRYTNQKPREIDKAKRIEDISKYRVRILRWQGSMRKLAASINMSMNDNTKKALEEVEKSDFSHPDKSVYQPFLDDVKKMMLPPAVMSADDKIIFENRRQRVEPILNAIPDPDEFKELRPLRTRLVEENNRVVKILQAKIKNKEILHSPEEQAEIMALHKKHTGAVDRMKEPTDVTPLDAQKGFVDWARKYVPDAFTNMPKAPPRKRGPKQKIPHVDPKAGYFIDEIQSDFAQSWAKKAASEAKQNAERHVDANSITYDTEEKRQKYIEKQTEEGFKKGNELWPNDKYMKFKEIVFGSHHPSTLLAEAFSQHLRDKGEHAVPVHLHSIESKKPISLRGDDAPVPVHFKVTYEDVPKALGLEPKQYGDLHTQTNPDMKGHPTWGGIVRKYEECYDDLAKAILPATFSSMVKATDSAGRDLVDYVPNLSSHDPTVGHEVEAYRQLQDTPDVKKPIPKSKDMGIGISRKVLFNTIVPGSDQPTKFMVKPYHEAVPKRLYGKWNMYPIQGWAEMTNQALYHAGDIGHLHQKVHVSEHDMGPGFEKEPALVIHMAEQGFAPVGHASSEWVTPDTREDLHKIAVMDFLSNNNDRHVHNLLLNPEGKVLAIDHSRSFQYVNNPYYIARGDTVHKLKKRAELKDAFGDYHESFRNQAIGILDPLLDLGITNRAERAYDTMYRYEPTFDWWGGNSASIRQEFSKHLNQIKDPELRAHIERNFNARADWLDEVAKFGVTNYGHTWYKDYAVPMYRPGEKSPEERENLKIGRLAQIAGWKK